MKGYDIRKQDLDPGGNYRIRQSVTEETTRVNCSPAAQQPTSAVPPPTTDVILAADVRAGDEDDCSPSFHELQDAGLAGRHWTRRSKMKRKRKNTEEDGDPSSIRPLSKLKKQKPNASEEEETKTLIPKPKADKDSKTSKNKKAKVEKGMAEEKDSYLPGQKHDTPHERDPFRIFLETLYQRNPDNDMAASWMLEWGLLSSDEAKKVYDKMLEKKLKLANNDLADRRTSTFSAGNLDVVSRTVSKSKKQKVQKKNSDDVSSDLNSRKKKKKKTKTKDFN
ncbi:muscle M-line assembly protein unc-89-like [Canna indica]|uniref:Muscle M-line assembly protein unc-89-like n=1 Tax=Canna indica TaxID=4628 RepID=A0AAQ3QMF4_9LILI|nr:muscle M-line assembly protein unc-89-like [Canna indica]